MSSLSGRSFWNRIAWNSIAYEPRSLFVCISVWPSMFQSHYGFGLVSGSNVHSYARYYPCQHYSTHVWISTSCCERCAAPGPWWEHSSHQATPSLCYALAHNVDSHDTRDVHADCGCWAPPDRREMMMLPSGRGCQAVAYPPADWSNACLFRLWLLSPQAPVANHFTTVNTIFRIII